MAVERESMESDVFASVEVPMMGRVSGEDRDAAPLLKICLAARVSGGAAWPRMVSHEWWTRWSC